MTNGNDGQENGMNELTDFTAYGDDELLSAYLDGELPSLDADKLTERLAREPALRKRLESLQASDEATRELFARVDEQPMPQAVLDLLQPAASAPADNVVEFRPRGWQRFASAPVAIAASVALAAGFLVSRLVEQAPDDAGAAAALYAKTIPADSPVYRLLEEQQSAERVTFADGSEGQVILSFADTGGDWCRQLAIGDSNGTVEALACRRGERWQTEAVSFSDAPASQYQQAAGGPSAALGAAIDRLIGDSQPIDKTEESRLIRENWKKSLNSTE
jgi:negative regulator of sigma E activity